MLKGETTHVPELVAGVLIVVYRYRNNLFHGEKWAYNIQGQLENFSQANAVLMKAIDDRVPRRGVRVVSPGLVGLVLS